MNKPSITIVVNQGNGLKNAEGCEPKSAVNDKNEIQSDSVKNLNIETLKPVMNKVDLLSLFKTKALPINNSLNNAILTEVNSARTQLYCLQKERTSQLYQAPPSIRPTYLVQVLKTQFIEYDRFLMAKELDQRNVVNTDDLEVLWQQIHVVDDLIAEIVQRMPAQVPVGWQLTSANCNHLKLPTIGRQRDTQSIADQASINSYVLGHFGVMSYTFDRGIFIGHILGYLFCCYYFAHLSINYGVTPLPQGAVTGYDYATLDTPKMVRLLQGLDLQCKRRIYQLAVICGRLSIYSTDKRIEKLMIAEVNDFDKKIQLSHLDNLIYYGAIPENIDELNDLDSLQHQHHHDYRSTNNDTNNDNDKGDDYNF